MSGVYRLITGVHPHNRYVLLHTFKVICGYRLQEYAVKGALIAAVKNVASKAASFRPQNIVKATQSLFETSAICFALRSTYLTQVVLHLLSRCFLSEIS